MTSYLPPVADTRRLTFVRHTLPPKPSSSTLFATRPTLFPSQALPLVAPQSLWPNTHRSRKPRQPAPHVRPILTFHVARGASQVWALSLLERILTVHRTNQAPFVRLLVFFSFLDLPLSIPVFTLLPQTFTIEHSGTSLTLVIYAPAIAHLTTTQ